MSTPPPPRSAGSGSTRQLLDDLDALMQRMLELPVNQLEDEPTAPTNTVTVPATPRTAGAAPPSDLAPGWVSPPEPEAVPTQESARPLPADVLPGKRVIAHAPAAFPPQPHTTGEPPAPRAPVKKMPPPDESAVLVPPAPKPTPPPVRQAPVSAPPPVRRPPLPSEFTPPAPLSAPTTTTAKVPLRERVRVPEWAWRALLWSNRSFDRSTRWLGNPGRWLRSPRGRTVLGWAGLVLWSVALALGILRFLG